MELAQKMVPARSKPAYLKIPPYADDREFKDTLENVRTWDHLGFAGVTASNSLRIPDERMAIGTGGYSGPPLFEHTKEAVARIRRSVSPSFEINACGGVSGPADAVALLELGATTVQVFTSLVYQGPSLMKRILNDPALRSAVEEKVGRSWTRPRPDAATNQS